MLFDCDLDHMLPFQGRLLWREENLMAFSSTNTVVYICPYTLRIYHLCCLLLKCSTLIRPSERLRVSIILLLNRYSVRKADNWIIATASPWLLVVQARFGALVNGPLLAETCRAGRSV